MKGNLYAIVYVAILALVCAGLLTAANQVLADRIHANQDAAEKSKILTALKVPLPEGASARQVLETYTEKVHEKPLGELTFYVYTSPDPRVGEVWGIPFSGAGLWGPVLGFLALDADLKTIRGISFYHHEETPGLGGEISKDWFQKQFEGKSFEPPDGDVGIRVARREKAAKPWEVDTITGATMTVDKVEVMVNNVLKRIVKERQSHGR